MTPEEKAAKKEKAAARKRKSAGLDENGEPKKRSSNFSKELRWKACMTAGCCIRSNMNLSSCVQQREWEVQGYFATSLAWCAIRASTDLAAWTGKETISRPEVTKFFWEYVKQKQV